jgi:hypothetical protein
MYLLFSAVMTAVLGAGAPGPELSNLRSTYGLLGAERTDHKYLPGDVVFLSVDIGGLQPDKTGMFRYRMRMLVVDAEQKTIFEDAQDVPAIGTVMGGKVRHTLQLATDRDQKAGTYHMQVFVIDMAATPKTEATIKYKYDVLPPGLGMVRFHASLDRFGQTPVPTVGVVGQMLTFHLTAIGFKHDRQSGEGSIAVEFQLFDATDRPVNSKPLLSEFKALPNETIYVPLRFDLLLQRPGQFKVVFKLTDVLEKKTTTLTVPLQVLETVGK